MDEGPLVLSQGYLDDLMLAQGNVIGHDAEGRPIVLDVFDFTWWGQPLLQKATAPLTWTATTNRSSTAELAVLYPFRTGAMVSQAARRIIEEVDATEVEFIPLRIVAEDTGVLLDEWWFVNVFHWRDAFDYSRSKLDYRDMPREPRGSDAVSARFGSKLIVAMYELAVRPEAYSGGLFLARGTTESIWGRVFVGRDLVERLNDGVPPERQVPCYPFFVRNIPQPPPVPTALGNRGRRRRWPP